MRVASLSQPSVSVPVFQGRKVTAQSRQALIPYYELENMLKRDTDPYLGEVPPVFRQMGKGKDIDVLRGLDWLAHRLNSPEHLTWMEWLGFPLHNPIKKMMKSGELKMSWMGEGVAGKVFRLDVGGQSFAFKLFGDWLSDFHPFREAATGMFFTARPTKDLSALYVANPTQKWTLMEYIPETASLEGRIGKTLLEQGYKISDEHAKNRINDIRIDHGGRVSYLDGRCITGDLFVKAYLIRSDQHRNTAISRRPAVARLDALSV